SKLVRFPRAEEQGITDFLVLSGMPAEALHELESFPTTLRAHCLLLLPETEIVVDAKEMGALFRLQQRTLAKGIVISSTKDSDPSKWMLPLFYEMSHNAPLDQLLNRVTSQAPVMFFDPSFFPIATIGTFSEKIATALERADVTPMNVDSDVARAVA